MLSGSSQLDDTTPLLQGTLGIALELGQALDIYNGTVLMGRATVSGTDWTFQVPEALALKAGLNTLVVNLVDASGTTLMQSRLVSLEVQESFAELINTAYNASTYVFGFAEAGQTLDLTLVSGAQQPRIDRVNLMGDAYPSGGGNSVKLNLQDVLSAGVDMFTEANGYEGLAAAGRSQVLVTGIAGGTVNVVSDGSSSTWVAAGTVRQSVTGETYLVYNSGSNAQLLIDADLTRQGIVI
jgi:hypothetical protein